MAELIDMATETSGLPDRATAGGDSLSFEAFFEAESSDLFRRMWLVTGSREEAEEISQDAFLRLLSRWEQVRKMGDPTGYLYRTAFNVARSRGRRARTALRKLISPAARSDEFAAAEAKHVVAHAMRALSVRQRSVIVLVELLEYRAEDAARVLGVKASTVRSLASTARASMRQIVGGNDE